MIKSVKAFPKEINNDTAQSHLDNTLIDIGVPEEFESMIPSNTTMKLKPFVDRYFTKYYKDLTHSQDSHVSCNQYAFRHVNKLAYAIIKYDHSLIFIL